MTTLKTPTAVRSEFVDAGISIAEWARVHGFSRQAVIDVLHGRRRGTRGEAHRVAIALGIKAGCVVDIAQFPVETPHQSEKSNDRSNVPTSAHLPSQPVARTRSK